MPDHGLSSRLGALERRLREISLNAQHNSASVSRGAFEIRSPQGLIVRGGAGILLIGNMDATGKIGVTGELNLLDGSLFTLNGTGNVTGLFNLLDGSTLSVDGFLRGNGDLEWEGPAKFKGLSIFDGDVAVTKTLDVTADSRFRARVRIEDDLELVDNGKFKAGAIEIDPANHNGGIRWGWGQELIAWAGALELYSAGSVKYGIQLRPDGVHIPLLPAVTNSSQLDSMDWLAYERIGGKIWRVPNDVGSPLGGDLRWPFNPDNITDGFGPRVSPGGIGSTDHKGVDWPLPGGTQIPAAGNGTVTFSGGNASSGFGYHVIIDHGDGIETLYAHQQVPSTLVVGQRVTAGQIVGIVGTTGTSTGDHLHFEVRQDGVQIDPEGFITKPWEPWL
ncbi:MULTISPECIES: M23 family metallopeptidase [unclassified Pseudoclavibacter]|uniref:M23 family metallopeptidase n=1 Tax=unclassified Pseudoclavibacter TaxID=2615177 RepID=UPI001BABB3A7|nr:M23 family metallopeptidase [Pseudoclavibacter sp. Marseille-Q4354]MBS3177759.1 M23 family metallopeptidase [Pseudoclavibacter sp. Marseille-Q4354]